MHGEDLNMSLSGSGQSGDQNKYGGHGGAPIVFMLEKTLFGDRIPERKEWLKHEELYVSIGSVIEPTHITGLQRVRGMWRIYLENLDDKISLLTHGVTIRGKSIEFLHTNPNRPDIEGTTRIRVKNIPLSVDDSVIKHTFIQREIDVISVTRERLRIQGKLTNCQTGDRFVIVKSLTLKEPLPPTMSFTQFIGRVIHFGQPKPGQTGQANSCSKCMESGHKKADCTNDWKCLSCKKTGHRRGDCPLNVASLEVSSVEDKNIVSVKGNFDTNNIPSEPLCEAEVEIPCDVTEPVLKSKSKKKHKNKSRGGQSLMDSYVQMTSSAKETPNRGKKSNIDAKKRTPPTPDEIMNDNFKKGKHKSEGSSSDSDSDE